jgi:mannose-6-phosphate isomerase
VRPVRELAWRYRRLVPTTVAQPLELGPNQIRRFYRGGARIAAFRGLPCAGDDGPEDWVAATTSVFGDPDVGPARLEDGTRLADLLAADPEAFFEPAHVAAFGSDPAVLLKLLDAGERLPLHFHPDRSFAEAHLGIPHGKSEAWIILEAVPDAQVHVAFAREVGDDELARLVEAHDVEAMVAAMNRLPVGPGDSIYVPAGVPHVIGEGILLLELQEPSDLSILLEWEGLMTEPEAMLGLPRELALSAVRRSATDLRQLTASRERAFFPPPADRFFRAERVAAGSVLEQAFSVLIVTEGEGTLEPEHAEPVALRGGSTVLVPFAAGACKLTGSVRAIRCRPPVAPGH